MWRVSECWSGNNGKLTIGKNIEAWEYTQPTFYTKPCLTSKEDPPRFSLHLHHPTARFSQLFGSIYGPWSPYLQHRVSCQQDLESKLDWYLQYLVKAQLGKLQDGRNTFEKYRDPTSIKFLWVQWPGKFQSIWQIPCFSNAKSHNAWWAIRAFAGNIFTICMDYSLHLQGDSKGFYL